MIKQECKIKEVWNQGGGEIITKYECGYITAQPPQYPDGSYPPLQTMMPLGLHCPVHKTAEYHEFFRD